VLLLVVLLHAIGILAYRLPAASRRQSTDETTLTVSFLRYEESPLPAVPSVEPRKNVVENKSPTSPVREHWPRKLQESDAITVPAENRIPDWEAERSSAVNDVLQKQGSTPPKRFEHVFPERFEKTVPGLFGTDENHRAGTVEDGQRYWASDNCFFDFDRSLPQRRLGGEFHLKTVTCKPPPTGGGEKMLDALTPNYLKQQPIADKAK
jgi:hypothetical protein